MRYFSVLVIGTRFGPEEVDELLSPYWDYYNMFSDEEMRADSRFVFETINIEKLFEKEKVKHPYLEKEYKNAEEWAKENPYLCYDKDQGWGYWCIPNRKGSKWRGYSIGGWRDRWTDFFLLKEGTESNPNITNVFIESPSDERATHQARKCDIDWEMVGKRAIVGSRPIETSAVLILLRA